MDFYVPAANTKNSLYAGIFSDAKNIHRRIYIHRCLSRIAVSVFPAFPRRVLFRSNISIICASAFLPFLPMTSIQILLLNLLYDTLCIVLPWDNVDEEEILSPRDWSGKTLKQFMLSFGPISSLFDIMTFLFLYYFLCPALKKRDFSGTQEMQDQNLCPHGLQKPACLE